MDANAPTQHRPTFTKGDHVISAQNRFTTFRVVWVHPSGDAIDVQGWRLLDADGHAGDVNDSDSVWRDQPAALFTLYNTPEPKPAPKPARRFTLTIDCDNDAFQPGWGHEVGFIMFDLCRRIGKDGSTDGVLRDRNGNTCGA